MTDTIMGRHRQLRCPEVVMAILGDPISDDPWGAMVAHSLLSARRILRKDEARLDGFLGYIADMIEEGEVPQNPADGPMRGVLRAVEDLHLKGKVDVKEQQFNLQRDDGPPIDLFHRSQEAVKSAIREWVRITILEQLSVQCEGENPRRKDMAGISKHINATATKSLMRIKESPIHNITAKHYRQLMASLIAGTHTEQWTA
mgnify:FL=1